MRTIRSFVTNNPSRIIIGREPPNRRRARVAAIFSARKDGL